MKKYVNKLNKKDQGFTLIELLAVIVILAILALIAIPVISSVLRSSRKNSFKESVNGAIRAAQLYETKQTEEVSSVNLSNPELELSGDSLQSGTFQKKNDIWEAVNVTNGKYCANGKKGELVITDGNCS